MSFVNLYIKESGDTNATLVSLEPSWTAGNNWDIENFGDFDSLRVSVYLSRNELGTKTGSIYLRISDTDLGGTVDETVFLTLHQSIPNDNTPRWYLVNITNGPYNIPEGHRIRVDLQVHPSLGVPVSVWHRTSNPVDYLVRILGDSLLPNKSTNPTPSNTGTGIVLLPTLSWQVG